MTVLINTCPWCIFSSPLAVIIGPVQSSYTITEGDPLTVCVNVSSGTLTTGDMVVIDVSTVDSTAGMCVQTPLGWG